MSAVILTLFGEEVVPEQLNAASKVRAPKKKASPAKTKEVKAPKAAPKDVEPQILRGWEPEKQYYSIGEVATLFKVKTSHIRFWTNEFALKVHTTKKGDRLYTPDDIKELRAIYHLVKERGFTINGAKTKLKDGPVMSVVALDLKQSLLHLRNQLLLIRNQLA